MVAFCFFTRAFRPAFALFGRLIGAYHVVVQLLDLSILGLLDGVYLDMVFFLFRSLTLQFFPFINYYLLYRLLKLFELWQQGLHKVFVFQSLKVLNDPWHHLHVAL